MRRRSTGLVLALVVVGGAIVRVVAQGPPLPPPLPPSTFGNAPDEVSIESGLRAVDTALRIEPTGAGARVRLVTRWNDQIVVEGSPLMVTGGPQRVTIKSIGRATVTSSRSGRRMYADSVEVSLSHDGWGYLKAIRRTS